LPELVNSEKKWLEAQVFDEATKKLYTIINNQKYMKNTQLIQSSQQTTRKNSSSIFILLSILITAFTVGFSVYFLQRAQFENLRANYEKEIQQLKIQISALESNQNVSTNPQNVINCGDNYDCLYNQISAGNAAKVLITEKIDSLSLEEKSEIKIEPINNQFQVLMTILELNKFEQTQLMTKSIVGSFSKNCPQIIDNLSAIEMNSALCITNTAEEAKDLAMNGLSNMAISKYSCKGKLIDEIKRICIESDLYDFPPSIKKPALYLYPTEKLKVRVKVDLKGIITKSEPNYYKEWRVIAEPNGLINEKYDYLFYEAQLEKLRLPEKGWIVEYKELENWFDLNLKKLGLSEKETSQFLEYWLTELPFSKYYEIRLLDDNFLAENMNLIINPRPKTIIRRIFYFKPLESQISLEQPNIVTPKRKGFTVVEWGGLLDK